MLRCDSTDLLYAKSFFVIVIWDCYTGWHALDVYWDKDICANLVKRKEKR